MSLTAACWAEYPVEDVGAEEVADVGSFLARFFVLESREFLTFSCCSL